jgi:dihydroxy-acid dehydratase
LTGPNPYSEQVQGKANEPVCVLALLSRAREELGLAVEASLAEIVRRLDGNAPRIAIISGSPDHPAHICDQGALLRAAAAIWRRGAVPFGFGIPVICDGTAQNHLGMCYSLESRNALTRLVVGQMEAHAYHGAFVIQGCDKSPFAVLNALALLDRLRRRRGQPPVFASFAPAHVMRGGTIPDDLRQELSRLAERAEAADARLAEDLRFTMQNILQCISNASFQGLFQRLLRTGLLEPSRAKEYERRLAEHTCHPQGGICAFNGTGNSCRYVIAALGLVHPALEWLVSPPTFEQIDEAVGALLSVAENPVCGVGSLVRANIGNAVRVHSAMGGSTNLMLHLVSAMICSGVRFTIRDYDRLRREVAVPQLLDYSLSEGRDLYQLARQVQDGSLAGVATVLHALRRSGVPVDEASPTVAGLSWGERLREARHQHQPILLAEPKRLASGVEVLSGNFFQTAVLKLSGLAETEAFDEKIAFVVYFENEEAAVEKLLDPRLLHDRLAGLQLSVAALDAIRRANTGQADLPVEEAANPEELLRQMLSEDWCRVAVVISGQGPRGFGMPEMFTPMQHINHNGRLRTTTAILSDGRYSGTSYGAAVGHITPEAWNRGGILYLQDGDLLLLGIGRRRIDLLDPLALRQGAVKPMRKSLAASRRELGERRLERMRERRRQICALNRLDGVTDAARGVVPEILWAEAEGETVSYCR